MKNILHKPEPFDIQTLDELSAEAMRLGLKLPVSSDISVLKEPVQFGGLSAPNRLCVQPMEGCDATESGAPGELTIRRYRRFAVGGFGTIWLEATAVDAQGRSNPRQLWLNRSNVDAFADLVRSIRESARQRWGHEIILVLQLTHSGRYSRPEGVADPVIVAHDADLDTLQGIPPDYPVVTDDYLDRLRDEYFAVGRLAMEAGFDGVDIKACHGCLLSDLLSATNRPGRYGGTLENRACFLREMIGELTRSHAGVFVASRISLSSYSSNLSDQIELVRTLKDEGVQLLSITSEAGVSAIGEQNHPLQKFMCLVDSASLIQQALPELPVVVGGLSWFRQFIPNVAAGLLNNGCATLVGVGRPALAYPDLACDLLKEDKLDLDKCCINCDACIQLIRDGGHAGCVVMDSAIYGAEYLRCRHFALDNLREEAQRCRGCEPAPCRSGCPARIDIPAFLKAFADDEIEAAYEILRQSNALPGMCSYLCPVGSQCEGRCVAGIMDANPIPIHDIQYAVCRSACDRGITGIRLPERDSGKQVAIVGGGPAGVSCAVTLLERGHHVVLFERSSRLGGAPELTIPSSRFTGAREEMETILLPALREARLMIKYGIELGRDVTLEELRRDHDAVFLAAGVWGEQSLGCADGVVSGVNFLSHVKAGRIKTVPERVILLAGGDSAMDSARVARELGAGELLIVYAGALAEMHWHMQDSWFRTEGVHFMTMTSPVGYRLDADGRVSALKIQRKLGLAQDGTPAPEEFLEATLIIEAMGLGLESSLAAALQGCSFTEEGLVKTAEGASLACGLSGVFAAGGLINGGASVVQCVEEGMRAGREIDVLLL